MKKILIILASLLAIVLLAAIIIPIIFKDDIREAIQKEIDNTVDANLLFDSNQFSVSLFKSFPDFSVTMGDVGLTGKGAFESDTLFFAEEFGLTLDIMSVISGEQIAIKDIQLYRPVINILITADGLANYDIVKSTGEEETVEDETSGGTISISMQKWVIEDGRITYIDESLPYYLTLTGVDHSGSGDFTQDVFDMVSQTSVASFSTGYDGVEYISNKQLSGDVMMAMDLSAFKFTFKENQVNLNGFAFSFDGWLAMPSADIDMDISFAGKDVDLKSVLSLTPGDYENYLEGVTAGGLVDFSGSVKGTYNDTDMPAVVTSFGITDGKIAYADYPIPMEKLNASATFDMPGADLSQASFIMDRFSMLVDGEQLSASLVFRDFEDYNWEFAMNGNADLEKITKIIPLGEMTLRGKINAGLQTKGRMSDLEAEQYQKLPTSGQITIKDFYYESADLPQGFGISAMDASFDPKAIKLSQFKGNAGKTDLNMSGMISNYLAFALGDNELLTGNMQFSSSLVDLNEWMTTEETEEDEPEDTAALEVIRIPQNIDFVLTSRIDQLIYDDITLKNFAGELRIKDGAVNMNQVGFGMLDGTFVMDGSYETVSEFPTYVYDLKIKELSIPAAFQSFNTVQKLAPFAEKMNGKFSTDFAIAGALGSDMMPIYETITGAGLINVAQAALTDVKLLSAVSSVTPLKDSDGSVKLKNVLLNASIEDGMVNVEPFDVSLGGYTTTISGGNSITGNLNYRMKVKSVPTGGAGKAVTSAVSSITGANSLSIDKVDLNMGVAGTFLKPDVKLLSVAPAGSNEQVSIKENAKNIAKEKLGVDKEEVTKKVDSAKTAAVDSAKVVVDEAKETAKDAAQKEIDAAKDKAKDAVKDLFKKKKSGGGL
jgi:hypothetical protein